MIYPDAFDKFYLSPQGKASSALILDALQTRWRDLKGKSLLSLGYALPYLEAFLGKAESVVAFMPGFQGGVLWPLTEEASLVALVDPKRLPLRDEAINRIFLIHLIELSNAPNLIFQEIQRVLSPEGRVIIVAPSLWGATWSNRWNTPFGAGRGYALHQLKGFLLRAGLEPIAVRKALYPPFIRSGGGCKTCERIASFFHAPFASVHLVEAEKRTENPIPKSKWQHGGFQLNPAKTFS